MRPQHPWNFADSDWHRDCSTFTKKQSWSERVQHLIFFEEFQLGPFHVCPLHAENVQSWVSLKGHKTEQDLSGHHRLVRAALEMLMAQVCSSERYSGADEWDSVCTCKVTLLMCPSLTLPKNAPVEMGLRCFCMFSSELFTLQRLFLSKKIMKKLVWGV